MTKVTHAMVMAAGMGSRMLPLTESRPKPLVEVGGRTLLDHTLDRLAEAGVEHVIVNVHYRADQIIAHLASRKRPDIVVSDETGLLLDTGGGVKKALPLLGSNPFLTLNTDALWIEGVNATLPMLVGGFDEKTMDARLLLAPTVSSLGFSGAGDFMMDGAGRLIRRAHSPVAPFVFAGVTVTHPRLFVDAPEGVFSANMLWDRAIGAGRLFGHRHEGVWMHVGTPDAVLEAQAAMTGKSGP